MACVIVLDMGWLKYIAISASSLVACYAPPAPDERFEDSIIVTSRDDAADFTSFSTFFVRPDVRILDEDILPEGGGSETLSPDTSAALVQQTTQNLVSRGYQPAATAA